MLVNAKRVRWHTVPLIDVSKTQGHLHIQSEYKRSPHV